MSLQYRFVLCRLGLDTPRTEGMRLLDSRDIMHTVIFLHPKSNLKKTTTYSI